MATAVAPEAGEAVGQHAATQKAVERFADEPGHAPGFGGDLGEGDSLLGDELVEWCFGGFTRDVALEGAEARRRGEHPVGESSRRSGGGLASFAWFTARTGAFADGFVGGRHALRAHSKRPQGHASHGRQAEPLDDIDGARAARRTP